MAKQTDQTTLISLFHTEEKASQALKDLQSAGIPRQSIQTLEGTSQSAAPEQSLATLKNLNVPGSDLQRLSEGLKRGGTIIVVRAGEAFADQAEDIFERHHANKVDERSVDSPRPARAAAVANEEAAVIPVVAEELVVGKRKVERGGVRVFSHVVEVPVEEQVVLREEHVRVERHPVNRPISEADLNQLKNQAFEVQEMAEEPVIGKTARVVEEVHVGKEATERTEHVKDTVRKTEVDVESLSSDTSQIARGKKQRK